MESKSKEFKLDDIIKVYVCGPTVYSDSHIGHARCYVTVDLFTRIMSNIGNQNIFLVMNITDIDKKIINRSRDENVPWIEISKKYEKLFFESMNKLNVQKPNVIIRVSECIPHIISYIQKIIDNGFAYPTDDGSIYFDSVAYEKAGYYFGPGVENEEYKSDIDVKILLQKRNKRDFALWKGRPKSDVGFEAEFNYKDKKLNVYGICGWHIECSCMIDETLGSNLDIHLGGIDLKFPHHHNENLQANAYHHPLYLPMKNNENTLWCKNFMHIGHVCVKGKKMAKSLKNYVTIEDALQEINANQLRWMFMTHKWDDPLEYSDETISHAKIYDTFVKNFLNRIVNYPFNLYDVKYVEKETVLDEYFCDTKPKILMSLASFELENASKNLSELINKTNTYINLEHPNEHLVKKIYGWILKLLVILGFNYEINYLSRDADIMTVLIDTRTSLRRLARDKDMPLEIKKKIFEILDNERNVKLKEISITLQDTKDSSSWFFAK